MSAREWVLIIGDLGIPEVATDLPETFENLIRNLRGSKDKKHVACTGNLGSSGGKFVEFFKSLVDSTANVHILKGVLPSCLSGDGDASLMERDAIVFKVGGVSIGMVSGYLVRSLQFPHLPPQLKVPSPSASLLMGVHCDFVICNDRTSLHVSQGVDGAVYLCPGSATGVRLAENGDGDGETPAAGDGHGEVVAAAREGDGGDETAVGGDDELGRRGSGVLQSGESGAAVLLSPQCQPANMETETGAAAVSRFPASPISLLDGDGGDGDGGDGDGGVFFSSQSHTQRSSPVAASILENSATGGGLRGDNLLLELDQASAGRHGDGDGLVLDALPKAADCKDVSLGNDGSPINGTHRIAVVESCRSDVSVSVSSRAVSKPSFMLLSISNTEVTLYTYTLVDGEVAVNQINFEHPHPAEQSTLQPEAEDTRQLKSTLSGRVTFASNEQLSV